MTVAHHDDDNEPGHSCPDCERSLVEVIETVSFDNCVGDPGRIDVERVCIGDDKYVGIRMASQEDAAQACTFIIRNEGRNQVGILWHAATARRIAAAMLNAADLSDGLAAFAVPDTLEGLDG